MEALKWIHKKFPPNFFPLYDGKDYELILYADDKIYVFGNAFLWCLGYDSPHVHLQQLVPSNEQHTVKLGSGIFLDEITAQKLIRERLITTNHPNYKHFATWFQDYIINYKTKKVFD